MVTALQDFVRRAKDWLKTVMYGAAAEPLAPMVGSLTPAVRLLPANARTFRNVNDAYKHLDKYHGIDPITASERLHEIKAVERLGAADNVLIDMTGNVYHPGTFELLGTLTQGGARIP